MKTPEQQLIDRITSELADQGRIVEGGWRVFMATGMPKSAPAIQIAEMRKAYFLGAQHVFASVITMLDPGSEPTDKDLRRMDLLHRELKRFVDEMQQSKNQ
jgi:hypothetical protein